APIVMVLRRPVASSDILLSGWSFSAPAFWSNGGKALPPVVKRSTTCVIRFPVLTQLSMGVRNARALWDPFQTKSVATRQGTRAASDWYSFGLPPPATWKFQFWIWAAAALDQAGTKPVCPF